MGRRPEQVGKAESSVSTGSGSGSVLTVDGINPAVPIIWV